MYHVEADLIGIYRDQEITLVSQRRHPIYLITYPLWGLWRDLLDVPFTALNRTGYGTVGEAEGGADSLVPTTWFMAIAGGVLVFALGWGVNILAGLVISALGLLVAFVVAFLGYFAYGYVGHPVQTALLRSGVDHAYIKPGVNESEVVAVSTWAGIDREVRRIRAYAFFPNWRYGVHRIEMQGEPEDVVIWAVERLVITELMPETDSRSDLRSRIQPVRIEETESSPEPSEGP